MARGVACAAFLLALLVADGPAAASGQDAGSGQRAYEKGRFGDALRLWLPAAQAGDTAAQFGLGLLYDTGSGVAQDSALAYGWYRQAANGGMPEAEFNVASMNDSGIGVARDGAAAALWYARAASHGNARAAYNLGMLYEYGEGVPTNKPVARAWYEVAAPDLPAARDKLALLSASSPSASAGALVEPIPERASFRTDASGSMAELVWSAPPQPVAVRYYVTVVGLDAHGMHVVAAATLDRSAALVHFSGGSASYSWRVYAVAEGAPHYAAGSWEKLPPGATAQP